MSNILINATALNSAGGRSIGLNFLKGLLDCHIDDGNNYYFYVPENCGYEEEGISKKNITIIFVALNLLKWYSRYRLEFFLKKEIKDKKISILFSMGNIALNVNVKKQVLLIHWPYLVYPESDVWNRMSMTDKFKRLVRKKLTIHRLKYVNKILFQTETMKRRFLNIYGKTNFEIAIVPNAVSLPSNIKTTDDYFEKNIVKTTRGKDVFLCLTRYYDHKNIEVLLDVAKLLKKEKRNSCILITIAKSHGKRATELLRKIEENKIEDYLINIGEVKWHNISELYNLSNAILLPTLLESYSGVYIESMFYNKPILTSKLDFAIEVCKDGAIYFNPLSEEEIYTEMKKLSEANFTNESMKGNYEMILKSTKGWDEITKMFVKEITI